MYYPVNKTDAELDACRAALQSLIFAVLRKHPTLRYFQGFHDIASVLLLVLDNESGASVHRAGNAEKTPDALVSEITAQALARLSLLRIRDFMLPSLDAALAQLALLPAILCAADPTLAQHLAGTQPFYALAGTLTMYAHEIQSYGDIARLFDYLLAQEAVLSIYLFAAVCFSLILWLPVRIGVANILSRFRPCSDAARFFSNWPIQQTYMQSFRTFPHP